MPFISKATYEELPNKEGTFKLTSKLVYIWKRKDNARILIRSGYRTNLATIPKSLEWLIPKDGSLWDDATILHDYALKAAKSGNPLTGDLCITIKDADRLLYDAMLDLGASIFTASIFYYAVRLHHTIMS